MFNKVILNLDTNLFKELENSTNFENITNGRKGTVLVDLQNNLIPIVRTTTNYDEPAQKFKPIHYNIIEQIKTQFPGCDIDFNNALVEIYDSNYRKMGFHTDQSLDLKEDSYICIFSCYEYDTPDIRTLIVKNKITNKSFKVSLENNSAVLFSTSINHQHLHKIVLESNGNSKNRWFGITFRLSKTFVKFIDNNPYILQNNKILKFANDKERREFYKHKGSENSNIEYSWPEINYTVSQSDLMQLV